MRRTLAVLAAATLITTGCSNDDEATNLRPADDVVAEQAADAALTPDLGETVELNNSITLRVDSIAPTHSGREGPTHVVTMRAENLGDEDQTAPEIDWVCTGEDITGGVHTGGTIASGQLLPPGTFVEGDMLIGPPRSVNECIDPYLEVTATGVIIGDVITARYPVPE